MISSQSSNRRVTIDLNAYKLTIEDARANADLYGTCISVAFQSLHG